MSRYGLKYKPPTASYELTVSHDDRMIQLVVAKWDAEESEYGNFVFDPARMGSGNRWKSIRDNADDVIATSTAIELTEFLADPEQHIPKLQAAAQEMVDYLAKIV